MCSSAAVALRGPACQHAEESHLFTALLRFPSHYATTLQQAATLQLRPTLVAWDRVHVARGSRTSATRAVPVVGYFVHNGHALPLFDGCLVPSGVRRGWPTQRGYPGHRSRDFVRREPHAGGTAGAGPRRLWRSRGRDDRDYAPASLATADLHRRRAMHCRRCLRSLAQLPLRLRQPPVVHDHAYEPGCWSALERDRLQHPQL